MKRLNPAYVAAMAAKVNGCPYFRLLSMTIAEMGAGTSRLEIAVGEKHHQPFGLVHGGVFSSLVDATAFWAVFPLLAEGLGLTTVEMKLNYLAPAAAGTMTAEGRCLKLGKTLALGEARVQDREGRLLAHGTATLMVLPGLAIQGAADLPKKFIE
jgi:uncharacterized protein (TIGR00369 family)